MEEAVKSSQYTYLVILLTSGLMNYIILLPLQLELNYHSYCKVLEKYMNEALT